MRFCQVGRRPSRWMIWVGMIKADNIETLIPHAPLDSDKVQRGNAIAVAGRINMGIRAGHNSGNRILRISKTA